MRRSEIIDRLEKKVVELEELKSEFSTPNGAVQNTVNEIYITAINIYNDCIGLLKLKD